MPVIVVNELLRHLDSARVCLSEEKMDVQKEFTVNKTKKRKFLHEPNKSFDEFSKVECKK